MKNTALARKSLERDLATYTSAAELSELDAILARYSEADSAEVRSILAGRRSGPAAAPVRAL